MAILRSLASLIRRLRRHQALAALALVGVTLACASGGAAGPTSGGGLPVATIGPAKPPSGPSVHEVAQTTTLAGTGTGPATATCPQGEVALGGGWELPSPASGVSASGATASEGMSQALPAAGSAALSPEGRVFAANLNGNTWAVSVSHRPMRASESLPVTAYVECLVGTSGIVITGSTSVGATLLPTDYAGGVAGCSATDGIAVGYGFDLDGAGVELYGAYASWDYDPEVGDLGATMVLWAKNRDSVAHDVHVYAYCLANAGTLARSYPTSASVAVNAGASGSAVASCQPGEVAAGGGLFYHSNLSSPTYVGNLISLKAAPTGWRGDVYAEGGSSSVAESVTAVCLRFS